MYWLYVFVQDNLQHSESYRSESAARAAFQDMIDILRNDRKTAIVLKDVNGHVIANYLTRD